VRNRRPPIPIPIPLPDYIKKIPSDLKSFVFRYLSRVDLRALSSTSKKNQKEVATYSSSHLPYFYYAVGRPIALLELATPHFPYLNYKPKSLNLFSPEEIMASLIRADGKLHLFDHLKAAFVALHNQSSEYLDERIDKYIPLNAPAIYVVSVQNNLLLHEKNSSVCSTGLYSNAECTLKETSEQLPAETPIHYLETPGTNLNKAYFAKLTNPDSRSFKFFSSPPKDDFDRHFNVIPHDNLVITSVMNLFNTYKKSGYNSWRHWDEQVNFIIKFAGFYNRVLDFLSQEHPQYKMIEIFRQYDVVTKDPAYNDKSRDIILSMRDFSLRTLSEEITFCQFKREFLQKYDPPSTMLYFLEMMRLDAKDAKANSVGTYCKMLDVAITHLTEIVKIRNLDEAHAYFRLF